MGVYKKDNRWYIDYYLPNGRRKREVVSIEGVDPSKINREDAKKALSIRKAEIAQGKFEIEQTNKPIFLEKLIKQYMEYLYCSPFIKPDLSGFSVNNLT